MKRLRLKKSGDLPRVKQPRKSMDWGIEEGRPPDSLSSDVSTVLIWLGADPFPLTSVYTNHSKVILPEVNFVGSQ